MNRYHSDWAKPVCIIDKFWEYVWVGAKDAVTAVAGKIFFLYACKLKALKDGIVLELVFIQEGLLKGILPVEMWTRQWSSYFSGSDLLLLFVLAHSSCKVSDLFSTW